MSDEAPRRYRIINQRSQPVELHCGHDVVVLPPLGEAEVDETARDSPQVETLARRGLVAVHRIEPPPPEPDAGTPRSPRRRRRGGDGPR